MNRQDKDRGAEMRLTEGTRKLMPETRWGVPEGAISYVGGRARVTRDEEPIECNSKAVL